MLDSIGTRRATALISRGALNFAEASIADALALLRGQNWQIEQAVVTSRQQVDELASRAVADGSEIVVAVGGDGTFAAVAGAIRGTDVVLAPLPAGTANGWAREMGIPIDPRRAARSLQSAQIVRVDVGLVSSRSGEHPFLATAGVGYDAAVVADTTRELKRWLSIGAYVVAATRTWPVYRGGMIDLRAKGAYLHTHALLVSIGNTRAYGGVLRMLPTADNTDGMLDVCVFSGRGWREKLGHLIRVVVGRHTTAPDVVYLRLPRFEIDSSPPLPVQADGDTVGTTPIAVTCERQAVRVLLPSSRSGQM